MAKILVKNIGCLLSGKLDEPVLNANSLLIEDGKIVEIGNDIQVAEGVEVIDVKGTTVMPGLLDSHTHPVIGEWTPRQGAMSWIDPYVRAGVTGLISVGEPHTPGKPKDAVGMKALATLTKQSFDNVRPAKMKVYAGAYMVHQDAPKEDFEDMANMGAKCIGEIGLGSANTVETAKEKVEWAKEAGLVVTCHRGAAYLHGSNVIDPDTVVALNPDVICHVTLGRITFEEIAKFYNETTSYIEITRPQLGSIAENAEVIRMAVERDELNRVLLGNDCPSGFGLFPHGIWELVLFAASHCKLDPGTAVALATGNTAKAFNLDDTGTIEVGKCADIVVCDAPLGSDLEDAPTAMKEGLFPGVSLVLIDGESVAEGENINAAPAKTDFSRFVQ